MPERPASTRRYAADLLRAALVGPCLVGAALFVAGRPAEAAQRSDVARELAVRDGARSVSAAIDALAGSEAAWWERLSTLDALERALATRGAPPDGAPPDAVGSALRSPHPNLRAAALAVLAASPAWAAAEAPSIVSSPIGLPLLDELALQAARAAAAALRGGAEGPPLAALLVELAAGDGSEREVRRAALGGLGSTLDLPGSRAFLAGAIAADWDSDSALRDAVAAWEFSSVGPRALWALASESPPEPAAVLGALAASRGGELDLESFVEHWPGGLSDRARFESIRLTALWTADDAQLERIVALAAERGDEDLLHSVVRAVGPEPLLRLLPEAPAEAARLLLRGLADPDLVWSEERARRATVRADLRDETLEALSGALLLDDPAVLGVVAALLPELPPETAAFALRLFEARHVTRFEASVGRAWERAGRPLDWIDRFADVGPAPSLRAGLLAVARERGPEVDVARALARYVGDGEVTELLASWFRARFADWRVAPDESSLRALLPFLRAHGAASGDAAVPEFDLLLAEARGDERLGRELARALAAGAAGRVVLGWQLDEPGWSDAARDEALIGLLEAGELVGAARAELLERLGAMGIDHERRAHRVLAATRAQDAVGQLLAIVDRQLDRNRALRALDTLGAIGGEVVIGELTARFRVESDFELRRGIASALAAAGAVEPLRQLHGVLLAGRFDADGPRAGTWPSDFRPPAVDESRRLLLDEIAARCASLGTPLLDDQGGVLGQLVERAQSLLECRFDRRPVEGVELLLHDELPALEALASSGGLGAALEASGPWWRGDGRALLACAARVATVDPAARELVAAAEVALAGEPRAERGPRGRAVALALLLAEHTGDWEGLAGLGERVLLDALTGRLPREELRAGQGTPWPAAGVLPWSELRALAEASRARAAFERGDHERAREASTRARAVRLPAGRVTGLLDELEGRLGR